MRRGRPPLNFTAVLFGDVERGRAAAPLGDFGLKSMYDRVITDAIRHGRYTEVTAALVADWGCPVHGCKCGATFVADVHDGGATTGKPLAKAAAR